MGKQDRYESALSYIGDEYLLAINWQSTFGNSEDEGACIPIAVFVAEFLSAVGFPSRPLEAELRANDPRDAGWMETVSPGAEWSGHLVSWTPSRRTFVDGSLQTQSSRILRNIGVPTILIGNWDHTGTQKQWGAVMSAGEIAYRFWPDRRGWEKRNWPWEWIREAAGKAATEWSET